MHSFYLFVDSVLLITLVYASWSDIMYRRIPEKSWYPLLIFGCIPTILLWIDLYPSVPCLVTIIICIGLFLIVKLLDMFWQPTHPEKKTLFGGADTISIIAICLVKPITLGLPTFFPLIFFTACFLCLSYLVPGTENRWKSRGVPLVVMISLAGLIVLLLP